MNNAKLFDKVHKFYVREKSRHEGKGGYQIDVRGLDRRVGGDHIIRRRGKGMSKMYSEDCCNWKK